MAKFDKTAICQEQQWSGIPSSFLLVICSSVIWIRANLLHLIATEKPVAG